MVRLNRGGRGRRRPIPRPPLMPRPNMGIRPMSPLPPFPRPPMMRGAPRGRLLRPGAPHHLGPPPSPMPVPPHPPRLFRPPPPPQSHHPPPPHHHLPPPPPHHHPPPPSHHHHPAPPPHHHPVPPLRHSLHSGRPMPLPPHPRRLPPGPPPPQPLPFPRPPLRGAFRGGLRGQRGVKRLGAANGRAKKIHKRKEKTEGDFFCETCDRGFKTQEKLDVHNSEHEVCGRDGCTFFAHPKTIVKHIQAQHDSGLFNRIVFTQSPAEIAKWIAERKSRFPTKENVDKKLAQRKEMYDRGERIQTDNRPFRGGWNNTQQTRTNFNNQNNEIRKTQQEDRIKPKPKPVVPEDPDAKRGNLPRFTGTASYKITDETISVSDDIDEITMISDDEESSDCKISEPEKKKPRVSNILASLVADYGSDMTDDDDNDDVTIVQTNILNKNEQPPKSSNVVGISQKSESTIPNPPLEVEVKDEDDSGPEECSVEREDKSGVPLVNASKEPKPILSTKPTETLAKNQPQNYYVNRQHPVKRRRPTLLEKLLQNEIRHERNVILQCVRYVVRNNYLGKGPVYQQS